MICSYTHAPQGEDIGPEGRCYRAREELIDHQGRQVLCLHVDAWNVTSCCGGFAPHIGTTYVVGYVVRWKCDQSESGDPVSEVEPLSDADFEEIKRLLKGEHGRRDVYPLCVPQESRAASPAAGRQPPAAD